MPAHPTRKTVRLRGHDYASPGAYFVPVCTHARARNLGGVDEDRVVLSPEGEIVRAVWQGLPRHFPGVDLDAFVVMPNHVHGILILTQSVGAKPAVSHPVRAASPSPPGRNGRRAAGLRDTNGASPLRVILTCPRHNREGHGMPCPSRWLAIAPDRGYGQSQ